VVATWADVEKAKRLLGYDPKVGIEEGLSRFVDWYRSAGAPGSESPAQGART
jgi:nucleoside-diphosphate-sugar epimerase